MKTNAQPPRIRLLLVEGDHDSFARIILMLEEIAPRQFTLEWAATYGFAVSLLRRSHFDLCLANARLGHRTGIELITEMRALACHTPVLLLADAEEMELFGQPIAPACDCLDRSRLSAEMLRQAIRETVGRSATNLPCFAPRAGRAAADSKPVIA